MSAARLLAMVLLVVSCKREQRSEQSAKPRPSDLPPAPRTSNGEWKWSEVGQLASSNVSLPTIGRTLPYSRALIWGSPPQIFDAKQQAFRAAPALPTCALTSPERLALVNDETVFAVGAKCGYDAEQDKWVPVPELAPTGTSWAANVLSKDDVLVTGSGTDASLWDHEKKTVVKLPPTSSAHVASLLLLDGTVLLTSKNGEKMELYEPSRRTFRVLDEQQYDGQPAVLRDGRVMFLASGGACGLYDPASTKWSRCPSMRTPRDEFAITMIDDGALVTGGFSEKTPTASVELYELRKDAWIELPPMPVARARHVALKLSDDRVLVAGGTDAKRAFLLTHTPPDAGP